MSTDNATNTELRELLLAKYAQMLRVCAAIERRRNNGIHVPAADRVAAHNELAQVEALLHLPATLALEGVEFEEPEPDLGVEDGMDVLDLPEDSLDNDYERV